MRRERRRRNIISLSSRHLFKREAIPKQNGRPVLFPSTSFALLYLLRAITK